SLHLEGQCSLHLRPGPRRALYLEPSLRAEVSHGVNAGFNPALPTIRLPLLACGVARRLRRRDFDDAAGADRTPGQAARNWHRSLGDGRKRESLRRLLSLRLRRLVAADGNSGGPPTVGAWLFRDRRAQRKSHASGSGGCGGGQGRSERRLLEEDW